MSNLEEYVKRMKQYKEQNPGISETQLVRHVYLDLGSKLSFNAEFFYGNSETKKQIYRDGMKKDSIEKSMSDGIAICNSMAFIVRYVLNQLGIEAITSKNIDDDKKTPHMYNIIISKEGKPYKIDLQEDIRNIQSHSRTKYFGLSTDDEYPPVINYSELEEMDKKDGYITDENYYADDYLDLLRYNSSFIQDFREKAKFIFENLEPYENSNLKNPDRKRRLDELINILFTPEENRKIRLIDCYYDEKNKESYKTFIVVYGGKELDTDIYKFSEEEQRFFRESISEFANEVSKGLKHKEPIWGLNKALRHLQDEER